MISFHYVIWCHHWRATMVKLVLCKMAAPIQWKSHGFSWGLVHFSGVVRVKMKWKLQIRNKCELKTRVGVFKCYKHWDSKDLAKSMISSTSVFDITYDCSVFSFSGKKSTTVVNSLKTCWLSQSWTLPNQTPV